MPKRKKKGGTTLPRVTLLAYSRRDLLAFVGAAEALRHDVNDLRQIVNDLRPIVQALKTKGKRKGSQPEAPPAEPKGE